MQKIYSHHQCVHDIVSRCWHLKVVLLQCDLHAPSVVLHTPCFKHLIIPFYLCDKSVKKQPILIISGGQNREETSHLQIMNLHILFNTMPPCLRACIVLNVSDLQTVSLVACHQDCCLAFLTGDKVEQVTDGEVRHLDPRRHRQLARQPA